METEFFGQFPSFLGLDCTKEIIGTYKNHEGAKVDYRIDFVLRYNELAVEAGKKFGIHPLILLAQAAVESGWGTNQLCKEANNFYSMLANENWEGKYCVTAKGHRIRIYESARDSFMDFARLLKEQFPKAAQVSNSIVLYADTVANNKHLPCPKKDQMCRTNYRLLIIRVAVSVKSIAKVFFCAKYN